MLSAEVTIWFSENPIELLEKFNSFSLTVNTAGSSKRKTKEEKMAHALITGGVGFVGSHLTEALLEKGWVVEVVDDLSTGSIENISHLKGHSRFSYILDDMMNRSLMIELIDRADVVFHLAAAVGVRLIVEKPVHTIETNIKATELVLEICARKKRPVLLDFDIGGVRQTESGEI